MSRLKAFVMGGVDGVITSFSVTAGASLMEEGMKTVAVVGFSSVLADGLSMGISEYLSSRSEASITERKGSPVVLAIICFSAFVTCGCVPLLVFLVSAGGRRLLASASFSVVELMLLGVCQSSLTNEERIVGLSRTTLLGLLAGVTAYSVAALVSEV